MTETKNSLVCRLWPAGVILSYAPAWAILGKENGIKMREGGFYRMLW